MISVHLKILSELFHWQPDFKAIVLLWAIQYAFDPIRTNNSKNWFRILSNLRCAFGANNWIIISLMFENVWVFLWFDLLTYPAPKNDWTLASLLEYTVRISFNHLPSATGSNQPCQLVPATTCNKSEKNRNDLFNEIARLINSNWSGL